MPVTLKQIAAELNVHQSTVTNALNGKPNVGEPLRLRIMETAQRMGYDKSASREAQLLIARRHGHRVRNNAIALVRPVNSDNPVRTEPFYRSLLDGVEDEAGRRGYDLYITLQREPELPRVVKERRVDATIYFGITRRVVNELQELSLPTVSLGTWNPKTYSILPDGEEGTYQATRYLIEQGHTRIAYVGGRAAIPEGRRRGYKRALAEHGLALDESLLQSSDRDTLSIPDSIERPCGNVMEFYGRVAMEFLMERNRASDKTRLNFTAAVCQNDVVAIGVVRQAQHEGVQVPDELSVIGFDDLSPQYSFQPSLTSVAYSAHDMGRRAVGWVCDEIENIMANGSADKEWLQTDKIEYFPTTLAIRDSTGAVAKIKEDGAFSGRSSTSLKQVINT